MRQNSFGIGFLSASGEIMSSFLHFRLFALGIFTIVALLAGTAQADALEVHLANVVQRANQARANGDLASAELLDEVSKNIRNTMDGSEVRLASLPSAGNRRSKKKEREEEEVTTKSSEKTSGPILQLAAKAKTDPKANAKHKAKRKTEQRKRKIEQRLKEVQRRSMRQRRESEKRVKREHRGPNHPAPPRARVKAGHDHHASHHQPNGQPDRIQRMVRALADLHRAELPHLADAVEREIAQVVQQRNHEHEHLKRQVEHLKRALKNSQEKAQKAKPKKGKKKKKR